MTSSRWLLWCMTSVSNWTLSWQWMKHHDDVITLVNVVHDLGVQLDTELTVDEAPCQSCHEWWFLPAPPTFPDTTCRRSSGNKEDSFQHLFLVDQTTVMLLWLVYHRQRCDFFNLHITHPIISSQTWDQMITSALKDMHWHTCLATLIHSNSQRDKSHNSAP